MTTTTIEYFSNSTAKGSFDKGWQVGGIERVDF